MSALALANDPLSRGMAPPPAPTPEEAEQALLCMSLGGRVLLVDASQFELDGTVPALVIRWDGSYGVEYAWTYDGHRFGGERSGHYRLSRHESEGCIILGRIMQQE